MKSFKFFKGNEKVCWRTHTGEVINICDLGIRHLNSILNCLSGHGNMRIPNPYLGKSTEEWYRILSSERNKRLSNN